MFLVYWGSRDGATAIEYGLIVAGLSVVIVVVIFTMGDRLAYMFEFLNLGMMQDRTGEG